jgi:hypothetical protein
VVLVSGQMKRVAIGIRAHSGWGALVVVSGIHGNVEIIDRRRIAITDSDMPGANQPYHFAQKLNIQEAERYLADCGAVSGRLALDAVGGIVEQLRHRECVPVGCAILLASGRSLPSLAQILASHSLIHTAEGEFFRDAFRRASERLAIQVTGFRERELNGYAESAFGSRTLDVHREIAALGRSVGPPWTTDQKSASLAALLVLAAPGFR